MSASITWTDGAGTSSLSPLYSSPSRFNGWTPDLNPIGPSAVALGTGQTFTFPFRNDLTVALEISPLPGASLELALRLKLHLMSRGQVFVSTDNFLASSFETCILAPGTIPQIEFTNRQTMEYTFSVVLKAGSGLPETTGGGLTPWSPADIDGLLVWLRGSSLIPTNAHNTGVGLWLDESGNDNHAVAEASTDTYPLFKANMVNGHPAVWFDGDDDGLQIELSEALSNTHALTVFMVWANRSASTGIRSLVGGSDTLTNRLTLGPWDALFRALVKYPGGGEFVDAGAAPVGEYAITAYRRPTSEAGTAEFYHNGELIASPAGNLVGFGTHINLGEIGSGYGGSWPAPADADLAELIVYNRELNDDETEEANEGLGEKYAIEITP
jgi:hypothetical protein